MKTPIGITSRTKLNPLALATALGVAAFFGAGPQAHADLIGHWLAGGSNLSDTSGFTPAGTHDGVAVGTAENLLYSTDVPLGFSGQSLDLQGNVGVMIQNSALGDANYLPTYDAPIRAQFSVAFWAKGFPGEWAPWVSKRGEGVGWQLRRMGNDPIAGFTMRGIDNEDGWGSPFNVNDSPAKWHHFAGVWNQATGTRTLYVDGVFSHVVTNNTSQFMNLADNKHLALGTREQGGTGYENYFTGKLFDVRIYNTPLTQSEVLDLIPPPVPTGLVATPGSGKVGLIWAPAVGATSYTVWTRNNSTSIEQTDTSTEALFSKTGLVNGTSYSFKVLATNSAGSSEYSAEVSATPELGSAKDILSFSFGALGAATISGSSIIKNVPLATDVTTLAPTYTISPFATEDAANPSGSSRNFTSPRTYTITAEDGSTKVYTVTVLKVAPITYNFSSGLQGWAQIWPATAPMGLWAGNQLGAGYDDGETRFGRSPEFYLNNLGDLSCQLDGGQSPLAAPDVAPSLIPELALAGAGFGGVALRDAATDTYVMSRRHIGNGNWQTVSFTATDLAPYANDGKKYTLDYIDYNKGSWGWTYMDNVSIPGTLAPAADITGLALFGPAAAIAGTDITLSVPYGTSVTALAPTYTLSPGATCDKASGSTQNFSVPVNYTVVSSDLLISRVYTVTVVVMPDLATALIGHWVAGAETLADSSGFTVAGTHDGVAIGANAASLAYNSDDVPLSFGGSSLDLTAGNVGLQIANSSTEDGTSYANTFDDGIRSRFTIAFWAKGFPGGWVPWVSKRGEDGIGWQVRRYSDSNFACFTMRGIPDEDGDASRSTINVNDAAPTWHHFTGVWDQAAGTRTLYVDGVLSNVVSNTPGMMMNLATAKHLALGARQTGDATTAFDGLFGGKLYDVRIYNQALLPDQVQTVMTTPTTVQPPEAKIRAFGLPGMPAVISGTNIVWTLPMIGMDRAALAPTFTLTTGATCDKASGSTQDFTTPQTYTVTASDSQVNVYTVTVVTTDTFSDGTLQGWHNRVWDLAANAGAGGWVDLAPNATTLPLTVNGGVIQPPSVDNGLFVPGNGAVWVSGNTDNHLNTLWLRSPQFTLDGSGDLTVQLSRGMAHASAPDKDLAVPYAAVIDGGWMGVALRRVSDGVFVLAKPRTETGDAWVTVTFSAAELEPFVGSEEFTLDLINSDRGGWGWIVMDNVVIPGIATPIAPSDPFTAWINANYPGLSDKTPTGDPDGDGVSNQDEFAFGLDPSSGTSVNPVAVQLNRTSGQFSYTRRATPALTGLTYSVWTSTDLQTWTEDIDASQVPGTPVADVETVAVTLSASKPLTATKLFVRVSAE